jgi:hypothetical protein
LLPSFYPCGVGQPPVDVRKTLYVFKWTGTSDDFGTATIHLPDRGIRFEYAYLPMGWITKPTAQYDFGINLVQGWSSLTKFDFLCWYVWGGKIMNNAMEITCFVLGA